jgi:hypothetical protein
LKAIFVVYDRGQRDITAFLREFISVFTYYCVNEHLKRVIILATRERNETIVNWLVTCGGRQVRALFQYCIYRCLLYADYRDWLFLSRFGFEVELEISDEFVTRLLTANSRLAEWIQTDGVRRELYLAEYNSLVYLLGPAEEEEEDEEDYRNRFLRLLETGGREDVVIYWYERLFVEACWLRDIEICRLLLDQIGIDANTGHPNTLGPAVVNCHLNVVRLLLEYGAEYSDTVTDFHLHHDIFQLLQEFCIYPVHFTVIGLE